MEINFAINGFGRIGRSILRALAQANNQELKLSAINVGMGDFDAHIHLLKYDSTQGPFLDFERIGEDTIKVKNHVIKLFAETDPEKIDWKGYGVNLVMECSGKFTQKALAAKHIKSGVNKVMVSAPCDNADKTIVYGINEKSLSSSDQVISIGSCTTNCLAPVAKIMNDTLGIESGFMTTIHSYTNDQSLLDVIHKDKRRARAAALSMIPSSTGAAKALGLVLPELEGKLDGVAIRVPTPNVSLVDLKFTVKRETNVKEINEIFVKAQKEIYKGVLACTDEELVSIDFNHNPHSSIVDLTQTKVVKGKFCRVASWYDNEWGFSNRMLDVASYYGKL